MPHRAKRLVESKRYCVSPRKRGYTTEWDKARARFLITHPYCATCGNESRCVNHIIAHRGDMVLFWDVSNWEALCLACHNVTTGRGE